MEDIKVVQCTVHNYFPNQYFCIVIDNANGMPFTEVVDPAIPYDIINLLHNLRFSEGWSLLGAVNSISMSLVPEGYEPYPFRNGVEECLEDMLKSVVANYRFRYTMSKYVSEGVDFSTCLYIQEIDEATGETFREREDHCHILKRIASGNKQVRQDHQELTCRALMMQCAIPTLD